MQEEYLTGLGHPSYVYNDQCHQLEETITKSFQTGKCCDYRQFQRQCQDIYTNNYSKFSEKQKEKTPSQISP